MAHYAELMAQAQALMAQAEAARKDELTAVVAEIREKMKQYNLTAKDLGFATRGPVQRTGAVRASGLGNPAKYRSPEGKTWSGMGRRPDWVNEILKKGESLEAYSI